MFHIPRRGDGDPMTRLGSRQDSGHLLGMGLCAHARTDVYGDPIDATTADLALAGG
jgi:hypothetical protein